MAGNGDKVQQLVVLVHQSCYCVSKIQGLIMVRSSLLLLVRMFQGLTSACYNHNGVSSLCFFLCVHEHLSTGYAAANVVHCGGAATADVSMGPPWQLCRPAADQITVISLKCSSRRLTEASAMPYWQVTRAFCYYMFEHTPVFCDLDAVSRRGQWHCF